MQCILQAFIVYFTNFDCLTFVRQLKHFTHGSIVDKNVSVKKFEAWELRLWSHFKEDPWPNLAEVTKQKLYNPNSRNVEIFFKI